VRDDEDRTAVSFNQYQEYFDGVDQWLIKYYQIVQSRDYLGNWGTATAYETATCGVPSLSFVNYKYTMLWEDSGTLYTAQESEGRWGEPSSAGSGAEPTLAVGSGMSTSSVHFAWRENASGLYKIVPSSNQLSRTVSPQRPTKSIGSSWVYSRVISMIDTATGAMFSATVSNPRLGATPLRLASVNDTLPGIDASNFFKFLGTEDISGNADDTVRFELAFTAVSWPKNAGTLSAALELRDAATGEQLAALGSSSVDLNRKTAPQKIALRLGGLSGRLVRLHVNATLPEWASRCVFNVSHVYHKPVVHTEQVVTPPVQVTTEEPSENILIAYPNPFNPETMMKYRVAGSAHVSLKVYDLLGREVALLVDGERPAGIYSATWNAAGLPSGTYICRLTVSEAGGKSVVRAAKMQYVR
jgi:hypothetical protein